MGEIIPQIKYYGKSRLLVWVRNMYRMIQRKYQVGKKVTGPAINRACYILNPETSSWVEEKSAKLFWIGPWGKKQTLDLTIEIFVP
jgi:hypothetical protein